MRGSPVRQEPASREPDLHRGGDQAAWDHGWRRAGDQVKGDTVEIVIDAGGVTRTYEVTATRAGRRVEVVNRRGLVEVSELTRGGGVVRTARFMASRVLALVEHPAHGERTDLAQPDSGRAGPA